VSFSPSPPQHPTPTPTPQHIISHPLTEADLPRAIEAPKGHTPSQTLTPEPIPLGGKRADSPASSEAMNNTACEEEVEAH
jgi:hypothetical protein